MGKIRLSKPDVGNCSKVDIESASNILLEKREYACTESHNYILFNMIRGYDDDHIEKFIRYPEKYIDMYESAYNTYIKEPDEDDKRFRPVNIPNKKLIEELNSKDIGTLVALDVLIESVRQKEPRIKRGCYKCARCEEHMYKEQDLTNYEEPTKCANENCGRVTNKSSEDRTVLDLVINGSDDSTVFIDVEELTVEDDRNRITASEPYTLKVLMTDDLCQELNPGQRVILNCIVRALHKKDNRFDIYGECVSWENQDETFEHISITSEEEQDILKASEHAYLKDRFRSMIAPQIKGNNIIKDAILLQIFGGCEKIVDTQRERGDISILIVGDPGVGKTNMIKAVSKLAPRALYSSGKGVSGIGLTASLKALEGGGWIVKAGLLVKADRGLAIIDEIEKMSEDDRRSIHEPMESGTVTVAKADIYQTMNARCSVLACSNPDKGRFNPNILLAEQITLDPALLSRFDLIFLMRDVPNKDADTRLANEVLRNSQKLSLVIKGDKDATDEFRLPFSIDFFRKYVSYAKKNVHPVLSEGVIKMLQERYVETRMDSAKREVDGISRVAITLRQLEALRRLSEAHARMRLSDTISTEDAECALEIYKFSMEAIGRDDDGQMNIDLIETGRDRGREGKIELMMRIIDTECSRSDDGLAYERDIIEGCSHSHMSETKSMELLRLLLDKGEITTPLIGKYKRC